MNRINPWWASIVRRYGRKPRHTSKWLPHQGDRECARRRGEIGWQARRWLS